MPISIKINKNEKLIEGTNNRKNFGYSALSKIYHELEIDKFLISKFKNRNVSEFKINNIMKLLVFADKGLNTGNNIAYNKAIGNGYVMSLSIRGANKDLKNYVLDENGYRHRKKHTKRNPVNAQEKL